MLLDKNEYKSEHNVEFLLERPVGWSSACFDSTIDYYINCANVNIETEVIERQSELTREN